MRTLVVCNQDGSADKEEALVHLGNVSKIVLPFREEMIGLTYSIVICCSSLASFQNLKPKVQCTLSSLPQSLVTEKSGTCSLSECNLLMFLCASACSVLLDADQDFVQILTCLWKKVVMMAAPTQVVEVTIQNLLKI